MSLSSSVPLCFLVCHHALLFARSFRDMLVLPRVFAILSFQLEAQKCQLDTTPWQLCHNKIHFLSMGLSRDRPARLDLQALSHQVAELGLTRVIFCLSEVCIITVLALPFGFLLPSPHAFLCASLVSPTKGCDLREGRDDGPLLFLPPCQCRAGTCQKLATDKKLLWRVGAGDQVQRPVSCRRLGSPPACSPSAQDGDSAWQTVVQ